MNAVLKGLPTELLTPEREQELFAAGDTETLLLHTIVPAFKYAQNARKGKASITAAEILSSVYSALSKSIRTFRSGRKSFLVYSKPFLRGEICKFYRDKNVVRDSFRHEAPEQDEFPKPLTSEHVEADFETIHWRELWEQIQPLIGRVLTALEIRVLEFRYKFCFTLAETGKRIDKSRERVRQIEANALQKLRVSLPKELNQ